MWADSRESPRTAALHPVHRRHDRAIRATAGGVTPRVQNVHVSTRDPTDDPVPRTVVLDLDEAFRVLEALEDARLALRERGAAPGLQDELATVIRVLHGKLGLDEGGVL